MTSRVFVVVGAGVSAEVGVVVVVAFSVQGFHLCLPCASLATALGRDSSHSLKDRCMHVFVWVFQSERIKNNQKSLNENNKSQCIISAVYKCNLHMCDPEATETFQKLPTHSRSYRNLPEAAYTHSRSYRNLPEASHTFQNLAKDSGNYRRTPGTAEASQ